MREHGSSKNLLFIYHFREFSQSFKIRCFSAIENQIMYNGFVGRK